MIPDWLTTNGEVAIGAMMVWDSTTGEWRRLVLIPISSDAEQRAARAARQDELVKSWHQTVEGSLMSTDTLDLARAVTQVCSKCLTGRRKVFRLVRAGEACRECSTIAPSVPDLTRGEVTACVRANNAEGARCIL